MTGRPITIPQPEPPPVGMWLIARTPADRPYPCRCWLGRRCQTTGQYLCHCWGRTDLDHLPPHCCAKRAAPSEMETSE